MRKLRVIIPTGKSKEMLTLGKRVLEKHQADADATMLKELDLTAMPAAIDNAIALQARGEQLKSESEQCFQDRRLLLREITDSLRNCRDVLTGIHKKDMKKLGNWGFTVVESTASKVKTTDSPPDTAAAKV